MLLKANDFKTLEKIVREKEKNGFVQAALLHTMDEVNYYMDSNSGKNDLETIAIEYTNGRYVMMEKQHNDTLNALKHVFG